MYVYIYIYILYIYIYIYKRLDGAGHQREGAREVDLCCEALFYYGS